VEVDVLCVLWPRQLCLHTIQVLHRVLVGVGEGEGEVGGLRRSVGKGVSEREQKLLRALASSAITSTLIIILLRLLLSSWYFLWGHCHQGVVDFPVYSLPPFLVIRHHPIHWPQPLRIQLPLFKTRVILINKQVPSYSNS
jgi:hypothetical protein